MTCNAAYWLRVTPLLEGVRAIALDFGGHGLSGHRDSYGYADYERDLLWLMNQLGLRHVTVAGHSLGGYVALLASTRSDRISAVLAVDVKSDWTDCDAELAERSRSTAQRLEPDRAALSERLARSVRPAVLAAEELELVAARSIEQVGDEWRFRWDRRVLGTEPVDPYAFLSDVRCETRVMSGSESDVMPPDSARRFAAAIPGGVLEVVDGVGHHVELDAAEHVARRILELSESSEP